MLSTKQLSRDQITAIRSWAEAGAQLPQIQQRIKDEFGIAATYMDTRFVILDLGIELVDVPKEEPQPQIKQAPIPTGKVTSTIDSVAIPGALVSGKVEFADGESATWLLDQSGRPRIDPETHGYAPCEQDIVEFQKQLRDHLQASGF